MNHPLLRLCIAVLALLLVAPPAWAVRGKKNRKDPKNTSNQMWTEPIPHLTIFAGIEGGMLLGPAADYFDRHAGGNHSGQLYGWKVDAEKYLRGKLSIGLSFGTSYVDAPLLEQAIRIRSLAINCHYRFRPRDRSTMFFSPEFGQADVWVPYRSRSYDLGTHTFVKIGFGHSRRASGHTENRFMLFYKVIFSDGQIVPWLPEIDFNTSYLGLEAIFGFGS